MIKNSFNGLQKYVYCHLQLIILEILPAKTKKRPFPSWYLYFMLFRNNPKELTSLSNG